MPCGPSAERSLQLPGSAQPPARSADESAEPDGVHANPRLGTSARSTCPAVLLVGTGGGKGGGQGSAPGFTPALCAAEGRPDSAHRGKNGALCGAAERGAGLFWGRELSCSACVGIRMQTLGGSHVLAPAC